MKPARVDLSLYRGSTFDELFTWYDDDAMTTPVDLTSWTAKAQFRKYADEPDPEALELLSTGPAGQRIVLGGAAGTINLQASVALLTAIEWRKGVWVLELTEPSGKVWGLLGGTVVLTSDVVH